MSFRPSAGEASEPPWSQVSGASFPKLNRKPLLRSPESMLIRSPDIMSIVSLAVIFFIGGSPGLKINFRTPYALAIPPACSLNRTLPVRSPSFLK
jgi:hypothetical protein